uniref:Uncharacterized protein n=1 Tax=Cladonia uncialis subsp. uncialis TaxID=180999 RepID=A0A2K9YDJ6_CLAUC|nr:hypothetical protein [Cladonia uncialis subsp. uncialis]
MRVQIATGLILFSLLQLYAVILAIALPATVPSKILNSLLTPIFTVPYNVNYSAVSPSNYLPPDPSYHTFLTTTVKFYNYGVPISNQDTADCLAELGRICMSHFPRLYQSVETPQKVTVGSVELHITPGAQLSWAFLLVAEHLLFQWLQEYEYRTLEFTQWYKLAVVATGNLSQVGEE